MAVSDPLLETSFLGTTLKNPILVGASSLTGSVEGVAKAFEAGAGGVVLKSLFEEQLRRDAAWSEGAWNHPETYDYWTSLGLEPRDYLQLVSQSVALKRGPVFASLHCVEAAGWLRYSRDLEQAGAAGLELNFSPLVTRPDQKPGAAEESLLSLVGQIRGETKLPLMVKLGQQYSALPWLVDQLGRRGVQAVTVFNRFYRSDLNLESMQAVAAPRFSDPAEFFTTLRWTGVLAALKGPQIVSSTGIFSAQDIAKALLVGAQAVQVCSVVYQKGWAVLGALVNDLKVWLRSREWTEVAQARGQIARDAGVLGQITERQQYIKALTGIE